MLSGPLLTNIRQKTTPCSRSDTNAMRATVHPFPARMAPDIAVVGLDGLRAGSMVLDPMCGSGVVIREAVSAGHAALGIDIDPLAVLMSKTWVYPQIPRSPEDLAKRIVKDSKCTQRSPGELEWVDRETREFIDYWFAAQQQGELASLASVIGTLRGPEADFAKVAMSRIIVTKNGGASLAADTAHSRPHRVRIENQYSVLEGFEKSAKQLERILIGSATNAQVRIRRGDARKLPGVKPESIDAIITSPPYVNAIDYLRGHRLALVWLGYSLRELRAIRKFGVGAGSRRESARVLEVAREATELSTLPPVLQHTVKRFTSDMMACLRQSFRVLRQGGRAVYVVANSVMRGVDVDTTHILLSCAKDAGFEFTRRYTRDIPMNHRYLPPPETSSSQLALRMRTESVIHLTKPANGTATFWGQGGRG